MLKSFLEKPLAVPQATFRLRRMHDVLQMCRSNAPAGLLSRLYLGETSKAELAVDCADSTGGEAGAAGAAAVLPRLLGLHRCPSPSTATAPCIQIQSGVWS